VSDGGYTAVVTGGEIIKEARLLAGYSQRQLADHGAVPRQSIARWEGGTVEPGFDTVRRLLRACGFDVSLVRFEPDETVDLRLGGKLELTPQERVLAMLGEPGRTG
jgi:transcriptional regulator with XRE-family HTH domain